MVSKEEEEEALNKFVAITDASERIARQILESTNWDFEQAVQFYYTSGDIPPPRPSYTPTSFPAHYEEVSSPQPVTDPSFDPTAATSQHNEHSFLGNDRLGAANHEEGVRAAIPQELNRLQSPGVNETPHNVMDAFQHISRILRNNNMGENEEGEGSDEMLIQMYKPPFELMTTGPIAQARDKALEQGKWVLVNIQDETIQSLSLNRDTWSDTMLQSIVSNYFVFWQEYTETSEGKRFIEFYPVSEYPFIGIIDPKTGEIVRSWSNQSFEPKVLRLYLMDFIESVQSKSSQENMDNDLKTISSENDHNTNNEHSPSPYSSPTTNQQPEKPYFPYDEYIVEKDDSRPSTRLQFRFTDGSRTVKRMRLDTPLAAIHQIFRDHMKCNCCNVFFVDKELPDVENETLQDYQVTNALLSARTLY